MSVQHFPDSTSLTFTYTLTGQRATVEDDRGTTHYVYDERDRLVSRTDPDGMQISYVYDVAGNRTALTSLAGTTVYTFDLVNRLETVTDAEGARPTTSMTRPAT